MKIQHHYDYGSTYRQSLQVNWQVDDIIGGEKTLNFRKPFLPEVWVDADALDFLSDNWLQVLGTTKTPHIDQGVGHQFHPVVALLDVLEPEE
jgi:hypothetical protein